MMNFLLITLFLVNINCLTKLPGNVSTDNYFTIFLNSQNDLIYYEPKEQSLYVFPPTLDPSHYQNASKVNTSEFGDTLPQTIYLYLKYLNETIIDVSFFDEKHLSTLTYEKSSSDYAHISMKPLWQGYYFYVFSNAKNFTEHRNTIQKVEIDFNTHRFTTAFTDRFRTEADRVNCYCASTSDNDIFCGLISKYVKPDNSTHIFYNFSLLLLDEDDGTNLGEILIESSSEPVDKKKEYEYLNILYNKYFISFPLEQQYMFYCFVNQGVYCGIARVNSRRRLETVREIEKIFDDFTFQSNLVSDSISIKEIDENTFVISLIDGEKVRFASISISNNRIRKNKEDEKIFIKSKSPYFIRFIPRYEDLILALAYEDKGKIYGYVEDLDYSSCNDTNISIYNAEKPLLSFNINASVLENKNDIVFINNRRRGRRLYSLLDINETVYESEIYDKENIYFNLSSRDYEQIKNTSIYKLQFAHSLDDHSQRCNLTINFKKCNKECEFCTADKCWDENWTLIYNKEKDREKEKEKEKEKENKKKSANNSQKLKGYQIALIVIAAILLLAIIVGIILYFKCRSKKQSEESEENEENGEKEEDNNNNNNINNNEDSNIDNNVDNMPLTA